MKVYVKKENKNSMLPGVIITIVFFFISIGVFISYFKSEEPFIEVLSSLGADLLFAIVFFAFSIYFIFYLIKRPGGYKAKLISKNIETYNGKQITYMKFRTQKERKQEEDFIAVEYECYTIGENNLIVENYYNLRIKEFNWEPKYVEEYQGNNKNNVASKVPNVTMSPVFFAGEFILSGLLALSILGIIMYPVYKIIYIFSAIFFGIFLFATFKASKDWKIDNNTTQNEQDLNLELEKIKPLDNTQEKVGNLVIKQLLILLIVFPIIWLVIVMNINIAKEDFMKVYAIILFIEILVIIKILYSIGYDERLIKKHKVNIIENINILNINNFNIFKANKDAIFPQYFIVDQNKNLIFKIKKSNFIGNKFVICNSQNIKIGEIKLKLFSLTNEFIINIINENPFTIRLKMQLHSNYQIIGRNYYVKGDTNLIRNIIYDNNGNDIAYISLISKHNNNWYELGNAEVILNDDVNNSIDIMIIALCITMGNYQTLNRMMDNN